MRSSPLREDSTDPIAVGVCVDSFLRWRAAHVTHERQIIITAYTCVLWDVDGTVLDGSAEILRRIGTVLAPHGIAGPTAADVAAWLGPPMEDTFRDWAGLSAQQAAEAVAAFDAYARQHGPETVLTYPGIPQLLCDISRAGLAQSTASAKEESQLRALLTRERLAHHFTGMNGARSRPGYPDTKADIVARALVHLRENGVDVSHPVLIGDRRHDVEAGRMLGIPVVFAGWGFGADSEAEGAVLHAQDVAQLREFVVSEANGEAMSVADDAAKASK